MRMKPLIISIAAVSGGGKTTITSQLNQILHNSKAIYFDEYDLVGPDNIIEWVERGSDSNEWDLEPLISDIRKLSESDKSIDYIIIDYPFSRQHAKLQNIDLTVFIDTPLDIAMARRILRDYQNASLEIILNDMRIYLSGGRSGYESMLRTTKKDSNLIVDGTLSIEEIVNIICDEIKKIITKQMR